MKMQRGNIIVDVEKLVRMCKGNPGAASALVELSQVDQSAVDYLTSLGIQGTDIYVLWSDICERNTLKMAGVLNATKKGNFDASVLVDACSRQDYSGREMVPVEELQSKS